MTADEVLERMAPMIVRTLQDEATADLQSAVRALSGMQWDGANFLEIVLDDVPFSMSVVGMKGRVDGPEAFQDATTAPRPLLDHPALRKIVEAFDQALIKADPPIGSDVWFGLIMKVAAWMTANLRMLEGRPELPMLLSIKDQPPSAPVCDLTMLGMWTTRYDFLAQHAR